MSLSSKLKEQRDGLVAEVEAALASDDVTAEALDVVTDKQAEIEKVDARLASVEAAEKRTAEITESRKEAGVATFGGATVTREAMTYDRDGKNSFVRDMIGAQLRNDRSSWERLNRHQHEVAVETRDISRTDGAGGDFVPPIYLNTIGSLAA
jgi:HK97 family phage major capsid protein